mgnify:CR=1 FL=1
MVFVCDFTFDDLFVSSSPLFVFLFLSIFCRFLVPPNQTFYSVWPTKNMVKHELDVRLRAHHCFCLTATSPQKDT